MICIAVTYLIKAGHEQEAIDLFAQLTGPTRAEPGCRMYLAHQSASNPRQFFLYEQYDRMEDLDTHRASPHFAQYATNGLFKLIETRSPEIYHPLGE